MLTASTEIITPQAYLEAERKSESKNEFINGKIVSMSGASLLHNVISNNLATLLTNLCWDKDFTVCQSDLRVYNPVTQSYCYPDVVVYEGEAQLQDDTFDNLLNPIFIAEVLSPATKDYDRGEKSLIYRQIPSLKEYLLVSQEAYFVEHLVKLDEHKWQLEEIRGEEKVITVLSGLGHLAIKDIYKKVKITQRQ